MRCYFTHHLSLAFLPFDLPHSATRPEKTTIVLLNLINLALVLGDNLAYNQPVANIGSLLTMTKYPSLDALSAMGRMSISSMVNAFDCAMFQNYSPNRGFLNGLIPSSDRAQSMTRFQSGLQNEENFLKKRRVSACSDCAVRNR